MSEETQVLAADAVAQEPAVLENEQNPSTEPATEEPAQQETEAKKAEEEEHRRKGGWQRKIEKQQKQLDEQLQQIAFLKGKLGIDLEQPGPAATPNVPDKPSRDKFQSDEEFVEALADWKVEQKFSAAEQRRQQEEAIAPIKKATQDFAATVTDYHETMSEATDVPCNDQVAMFLRDPEIGPPLGYFLAKNPDVAENLVKLGPAALAKEISALEPRFLKSAPSSTATVSKAPPPPTTAGKTSTQTTKDPGDMSPAEYRAWRAKTYPDL